MVGVVYERESIFHPDTCGCVIARDESDQTTDDAVHNSSTFVYRCPEHEAVGSSALDVVNHNVSKNVMVGALLEKLPEDAWIPIMDDDATPTQVRDSSGNVVGWHYHAKHVVGRRLQRSIDFVLSPKTGKICLRHHHVTPQILAHVSAALDAHPKANLALADVATTTKVFRHFDTLDEDKKSRPLFWHHDDKGGVVLRSNH